MDWFEINNIDSVDSPALLVYPDRIKRNIEVMLGMVDNNPARLRPHVKTYKMGEVVQMQMEKGIHQFKCATIAEGEMLGEVGARDVLLAYQPVGPKIERFFQLINKFPQTNYSTLIDNPETAISISDHAVASDKMVNVWIDLDSGNHRTGIQPELAISLYEACMKLKGIRITGLHAYDGHLRQKDFRERKSACDEGFKPVQDLQENIYDSYGEQLPIIAGGTPAFPCHASRDNHVICSPGTCLLYDWGYSQILSELDFSFAALVLTRIISKVGKNRITLDLGHKAIASENPFPRVHFLNLMEGKQISHSEEHLIIEVPDNSKYSVGEIFYGVPFHICPTCALYDRAQVVEDHYVKDSWKVIGRNRTITV